MTFFEEDTPPEGLVGVKRRLNPIRSRKPKTLHQQRFVLANRLLLVVGGLAVGLLIAVWFGGESRLEGLKTLAPIIFGPLVTLLGTSYAWYYAGGNPSRDPDTDPVSDDTQRDE